VRKAPLARLTEARSRSRPVYAVLAVCVIALGLASRRFAGLLPPLLHKNAGDVFWAMMAFLLFALALPRLSTLRVAALSALFSLSIELLKFCHAPWLDGLRATTAGRLVFGYAFSWSNLVCYSIGVAIGAGLDLCTPNDQSTMGN
jgi:hypothetical protein